VGLVQRVLEQAGVATISLSQIPALTAAVGVPRVAGISYPMSRALGEPGDADGQRAVLRATLEALASIDKPGTVVDLPFRRPGSRLRGRGHPRRPPPLARLLLRKPWLLRKLLKAEIPPPPDDA
jgi:D-proline reductase (dithiol) PrdB